MRLCTICARGGSKGIKNKNLKFFFGQPLLAHMVRIADESDLFDAIAVSSDSDEILKAAESAGADYLIVRPEELATDTAAKLPVIQHCVTEVQKISQNPFYLTVDLSVTAPLLIKEDIEGVMALLIDNPTAENIITGSEAKHSPYFSQVEMGNDGFVKLVKSGHFVRRQDCPPCFDMNGAIYAWRPETLMKATKVITEKTLLYPMPASRSIDIDTPLDLELASYVYSKRRITQVI